MSPRPFRIAISDSAIADIHARLAATRWPDEVNHAEWSYGTSLPAIPGDVLAHRI